MRKSKEKGVTLIVLVTTIVILLILVSIGVTSGTTTIKFANFSQFKNELKILQTKINELNEKNEFEIGQELPQISVDKKNFLNKTEISNIIYNNISDDEIIKIQEGFKYYSIKYLQDELGLEGIKRDYLINIEYRYVVCCEGFNYDGVIYYMIDQIDSEMYNIRYKDKNSKEEKVTFSIDGPIREDNRWRINIVNIEYSGYINNWQVRYRLNEDSYWRTINGLSFYVTKEGNYYVQVVHDEISSDPCLISVRDETSGISNEILNENDI